MVLIESQAVSVESEPEGAGDTGWVVRSASAGVGRWGRAGSRCTEEKSNPARRIRGSHRPGQGGAGTGNRLCDLNHGLAAAYGAAAGPPLGEALVLMSEGGQNPAWGRNGITLKPEYLCPAVQTVHTTETETVVAAAKATAITATAMATTVLPPVFFAGPAVDPIPDIASGCSSCTGRSAPTAA